jgi:hypothetical protein
MKRKSGQHRPDRRKLQRSDASCGPLIREGTSFTQLELLPNQVPGQSVLPLLLLANFLSRTKLRARAKSYCYYMFQPLLVGGYTYRFCSAGGDLWLHCCVWVSIA